MPGRKTPNGDRVAAPEHQEWSPEPMYATYIFPRLMDWVLRGERFQIERQRLLAPAGGVVLEIRFGTGLNLPHYPRTITALHSVDPAP